MYVVRGAYHPYIREIKNYEGHAMDQGVYSKNEFKVLYTNCDCLTKSKINNLECSNKLINPNIICLTEVLPRNRKLEYNKNMYNLTDYVIVLSGVPQGTVLGPLLFLIMISDINKGTTSSKLVSFADDTRVY